MRRPILLIARLALAGALLAPGAAEAWVSAGLGTGYAGPYVYPYPYPPAYACPPPVYCPPAPYYPPAYYPAYPPGYYGPGVYWPSYGPDVAVRWNRYFTPEHPQIRGYTLPR